MNKKLADKSNRFSTHDLGCSAALISVGFVPLSLNKSNPKKILFVFNGDEPILRTAKKYWKNKLKVDAQQYFYALRQIKNQIYSDGLC